MKTKVVAKLKTSTVKNVVAFGDKLLAPPYDIVKTEVVPGRGRRFRIICHRLAGAGNDLLLEDHVREVQGLLDGFQATSRHGAVNRLSFESIVDVGVVSDDGTISMEAAFMMPTHTF